MKSSDQLRWKNWQGAVVSFWPKPEQYDAGGYKSCTVFIGQVIGIIPQEPSKIGGIPNADMIVRGFISHREIRINSLTHNVRKHRSYEEAIKRQEGIYE